MIGLIAATAAGRRAAAELAEALGEGSRIYREATVADSVALAWRECGQRVGPGGEQPHRRAVQQRPADRRHLALRAPDGRGRSAR